jgi:hypothetical protein
MRDASMFLNPARDLIGADREHHHFFNVVVTLCRHCNEARAGPRRQCELPLGEMRDFQNMKP